jgi:hypothetical protein
VSERHTIRCESYGLLRPSDPTLAVAGIAVLEPVGALRVLSDEDDALTQRPTWWRHKSGCW